MISIIALPTIIIGAFSENNEEKVLTEDINNEIFNEVKLEKNVARICDGINIIEDCELNGKKYVLYKYHPPVEEVSHIEKVKKYKTVIVGYCTLCRDGTYSPTCATGRGACSHHGGVAQWSAPIYNQVEYYEEVKVIDVPASKERYEIIEKID